jgi:hypothetical protein
MIKDKSHNRCEHFSGIFRNRKWLDANTIQDAVVGPFHPPLDIWQRERERERERLKAFEPSPQLTRGLLVLVARTAHLNMQIVKASFQVPAGTKDAAERTFFATGALPSVGARRKFDARAHALYSARHR